ncbi:hypothetical protein CB0940_09169 [Cercospora beticola]|uniref:Uncharacterized protein n=1 Tax=Cercospora beticola TaxID=122368 RepID=A0A2G5HH03_CERBT|nr:hypothetical protein CB0940_09169 [Cercospora beticola]PIA91817.1 hypothetical protein CB0940_09169 [Cercospora beticola]WPB06542.1 hypothetical protein RHO25_011199 [Cercospora beticola]CAK1366453.1 unnamed protein product [Cercospora beticola]
MGRASIAAFFWLFATTAIVTLVTGYTPRILGWPLGLWIDLTVARVILSPLYWYVWPVLRPKIEAARRRSKESRKAQGAGLGYSKSESKVGRAGNSQATGEMNENGPASVSQVECHT